VTTTPIRVRFAPSPTGYLHIGGARTALFNWLLARKHGGAFILRIEDTDQGRHVADSLDKILADMRWLGLNWDEGPEASGATGPYFQSERLETYRRYTEQLLERGLAYYAMETSEELAALRAQFPKDKGVFRYPRPDPLPTVAQGEAARAAGRPVVVRFKMPGENIIVHDVILGDVELAGAELEDFVIQKGDGWPTYHFACVVDDELMGVTHVLRGQEHLINTPKHVAMQRALGFRTPVYAHLPVIFNMNGTKMSKRDKEKALKEGRTPPEIDVHDFRVAGYLPEALINFVSLLGWSTGDETEQLSIAETMRRFEVQSIGRSNAKFDRDKLLAFNTDWAQRVEPARLLEAFKDFLAVNDLPMRSLPDDVLAYVLRVTKGFRTFRDVTAKAAILFADDATLEYDPKAVKKVLQRNEGQGFAMLASALPQLEALADWTVEALEPCIASVCAACGCELGAVAQPIRVAVTGTSISPPIFDTLVLLGRAGTLRRIRRALALKEQG
jgi:glutamyl-tRNA synthetase